MSRRLPEDKRQAILAMRGRPYKEIAATVGSSEKTIGRVLNPDYEELHRERRAAWYRGVAAKASIQGATIRASVTAAQDIQPIPYYVFLTELGGSY